jgi:hypothetical protein
LLLKATGSIDFHGFVFPDRADFSNAQFHGEASFDSASLESGASFLEISFGSKAKPEFANITAVKAERAFRPHRAKFSIVPFYNRADFKQAPDLGNVSFPPGLLARRRHRPRSAISRTEAPCRSRPSL